MSVMSGVIQVRRILLTRTESLFSDLHQLELFYKNSGQIITTVTLEGLREVKLTNVPLRYNS